MMCYNSCSCTVNFDQPNFDQPCCQFCSLQNKATNLKFLSRNIRKSLISTQFLILVNRRNDKYFPPNLFNLMFWLERKLLVLLQGQWVVGHFWHHFESVIQCILLHPSVYTHILLFDFLFLVCCRFIFLSHTWYKSGASNKSKKCIECVWMKNWIQIYETVLRCTQQNVKIDYKNITDRQKGIYFFTTCIARAFEMHS